MRSRRHRFRSASKSTKSPSLLCTAQCGLVTYSMTHALQGRQIVRSRSSGGLCEFRHRRRKPSCLPFREEQAPMAQLQITEPRSKSEFVFAFYPVDHVTLLMTGLSASWEG